MHAADLAGLEKTIEAAFDNRDSINTSTRGEVRDAVAEALNLLDNGKAASRRAAKTAPGPFISG